MEKVSKLKKEKRNEPKESYKISRNNKKLIKNLRLIQEERMRKMEKEDVNELTRKFREEDLPLVEQLDVLLKNKVREEMKKEYDEKTEEEKLEFIENGIERLIVKIDELSKERDEIDKRIGEIIKNKEWCMILLGNRKYFVDKKKKEQHKKKKKEVIEIEKNEGLIERLEKGIEKQIIAIDKLNKKKDDIGEEIDYWVKQKEVVENFVKMGKYTLARKKYEQNKKKRKEDKNEKGREKKKEDEIGSE